AEERRRGFDFLKPPLMTVRLFRLGEDRYRFVRSFHHILIDACCLSPMLVELRDSYQALCRGEAPDFGPAPQFRRYIAWLQGRDDQSAEQFWRNNLQGFAEATPFNVDRPAAAGEINEGVGDAILFLSEEETATLSALAQRCRLTPNTFVQAAWALMLSRYSGRKEILFRVTVSGRPAELPGSEWMLGVFINTLPLRVSVAVHQSLPEFLQGLFARNLEIRQYEHVPLGRIQGWSEIPREQPLFESLLVFENYPVDPGLRTG
ncbi:MAG: condensation domain-containing protein, partial [Methylococcales bacterium]